MLDAIRATFGSREASSAATIRQCRADLARLRKEHERAQKLEANARARLGHVEPARLKLQKLQERDVADRRERVESGRFGSSGSLKDAIEDATAELAEAERNDDAVRDVLPSLEQKTREAKAAVESAISRLDELAWNRRIAELSAELPEVRAASELLTAWSRRVAVLRDVSLRWKLCHNPHGAVPPEFTKLCAIPQYDVQSNLVSESLAKDSKIEREYLTRLRDSL